MGDAPLSIRLLGELDLRLGGSLLPPLESSRARSLLAYLLLHRNAPQPRQRLSFLFWPDSTEPQARTNLRHLLHKLLRTVPALAPFLDVREGTLQWRTEAPYWLDVAAFEDTLARAEKGDAAETAALQEAVAFYRGDLLEGCYDEWIEPERDRLRRRYVDALEHLTGRLETRGDHAAAIGYAQELLSKDPFDEATYRRLMRLYAARGDRARALRIYSKCVAMLERELGVQPSAATLELYEALLPAAAERGGSQELGRAESPPFVGRVSEWERLSSLWRTTEKGRSQLVLIAGEAGIGKTRLVEQLRSWCAQRGAVVAEARAYAAEGELAYGLVMAWLRSGALKPRLGKLDRGSLTELARLLPELLDKVPELPRPDPLPESEQRARLFAAVAKAILGAAEPLVLIADDLHWCDRETLQLLHHLLRVEPDAALLVAATARREELGDRHPLNDLIVGLRMLERVTEIELARLSLQETAALGEQLSGRPLAAAGVDRLYAETEGNPLFVVEALRAGWDASGGDRAWSSPKVQAVIEFRLAQLTDAARNLAGLAATIGREFTTDVLEHASTVDDESLVRSIDELWRRGIVRERGAHVYDFSHDSIREVSYANLSPARRRHEHWAVAQALERIHTLDPRPVSGQIAVHYERAGMTHQAIAWYETAAEAAQRLYAMTEAGRLLERALEIAHSLPKTIEGEAREFALLTLLLTPVASVDGWASRRLAELQRRALELARSLCVEPPPQLLYSLALASLSRDDFEAAQRYGDQLRVRGKADGDDAVLLVESDYVLGIAAFWQGELDVARRHFQAAAAGYGPELRRAHLMRYWLDPQVVCLSRLGNTLWFLGDPEAAVRARDNALALAENVNDPPSRATALVFAALLAVEMEDTKRLREYVAALEGGLSEHEGRPNRVAAGLLQAFLRVLDGETTSGLAEMQSTLDDPSGTEHAPGMRAVIGRLLLAAYTEIGKPRGRLEAANQLLRMGGAARLWEAEALRARAECIAEFGAPSDAVEAELQCAIRVACRQEARMLEQKATASLLRYRPAQGRGSESTAKR